MKGRKLTTGRMARRWASRAARFGIPPWGDAGRHRLVGCGSESWMGMRVPVLARNAPALVAGETPRRCVGSELEHAALHSVLVWIHSSSNGGVIRCEV